MPNWEDKTSQEIRNAIESALATPGFSLAEKIFRRYLKAPSHAIPQPLLQKEFGGPPLSAHFGGFCKAIAKELGDPSPPPYALTDLIVEDGVRIRRLKQCVVKAMEI